MESTCTHTRVGRKWEWDEVRDEGIKSIVLSFCSHVPMIVFRVGLMDWWMGGLILKE